MRMLVYLLVVVLNIFGAKEVLAAGPRAPVGPQTQAACVGVALVPGANIQSAVNSNPVNTKFCLAAGTYSNQKIVPKSGNTFEGVVGTILDGKNTTVRAFDGNSSNVTIKNLVIKNYKAGYQDAPIYAVNATGWQILNNDISYNAGVGLLFKSNILVQYNKIHHNREMGIGSDGSWASPGVGINFIDNDVSYNNYTDAFSCDECGGSKLWATEGAYIAYNVFHHNHGPGLWFDFNNIGALVEQNFIHDNFAPGIHYEISYDVVIRNNVVWNNGNVNWPKWNCDWFFCSQILIAASGGVGTGIIDIHNNSIITNGTGDAIGLIQQDRTNSDAGAGVWEVRNVKVHNNGVNITKGGNIGGVQDLGSNKMFQAAAGNLFSANTYTLGSNTSPFSWNNAQGDKTFWQGYGMDLKGIFK